MLMQHRGDIAAWLRLQLTPGVGAVSTRRLLAAISLPDQIFRQSQSALEAVVSEKQAKALLREPVGFSVALQNLEGWLNQNGQRFVALGDTDYPQSLLQSPDPPLCLYVQCADWQWWQLWAKEKQPPLLGMVGSRKPSPQGERTAQTWAKEITQSGFSVISGLALGVDAAAHKGALQAPFCYLQYLKIRTCRRFWSNVVRQRSRLRRRPEGQAKRVILHDPPM